MHKPISTCANPTSVSKRIMSRISTESNGCWNWQGSIDRYGYGRISIQTPDGRRATGAHRAAWLSMRGAISNPALQIDHLCRNRRCVNPDHMELVTNQVNSQRADHSGKAGKSGRARAFENGHTAGCSLHGMSYGRMYTTSRGYTAWACQTCASQRVREFLQRKREAAAAKRAA